MVASVQREEDWEEEEGNERSKRRRERGNRRIFEEEGVGFLFPVRELPPSYKAKPINY